MRTISAEGRDAVETSFNISSLLTKSINDLILVRGLKLVKPFPVDQCALYRQLDFIEGWPTYEAA